MIHRYIQSPIITCLMGLLLLSACSEPDSPEQQIRNTVEAGVQSVESRSVTDFRQIISDNYLDSYNHDKKAVTRLATGYFLRNKNIHLFTQIKQIHFPVPAEADVQLYVAMTAQPNIDIANILNLRADVYLFELKFVQEDEEWKVINARWSKARLEDLVTN